jgi:hypothetical protein
MYFSLIGAHRAYHFRSDFFSEFVMCRSKHLIAYITYLVNCLISKQIVYPVYLLFSKIIHSEYNRLQELVDAEIISNLIDNYTFSKTLL